MNENSKEKISKIKNVIKRNAKPITVAMFATITTATIVYLVRKDEDEETSIYSYGANSIWKVEATEKEVNGFNRFLKAFYDAQKKLLDAGTPWDQVSPLKMDVSRSDRVAYNRIGKRFNEALKDIDQEKTPVEIEDDFLVKN